jgi:hypothetical protein
MLEVDFYFWQFEAELPNFVSLRSDFGLSMRNLTEQSERLGIDGHVKPISHPRELG